MKLFKRYKAIVHVNSVYSLLQYLLLAPYPEEDTLFMFRGFPAQIESKLDRDIVLDIYQQRIAGLYIPLYIRCLSVFNKDIAVYISGPVLYADLLMDCFRNVYMLEDGLENYKIPRITTSAPDCTRWYRRFLRGRKYPVRMLSERIRKICLTGILPIPEPIRHKVELFNLKDCWDKKSEAEKQRINRILLPEELDLDVFKDYSVLLLTQPYSGDFAHVGFTEKDQIDVYRKLVASYDEKELCIKVHPRDRIDYQKYFPDAYVFNYPSPMEGLVLNGVKIKTALTINSTAIFMLGDEVEKIDSGIEDLFWMDEYMYKKLNKIES